MPIIIHKKKVLSGTLAIDDVLDTSSNNVPRTAKVAEALNNKLGKNEIAKSATKLATTTKIGKANFDGSRSITVKEIGALEDTCASIKSVRGKDDINIENSIVGQMILSEYTKNLVRFSRNTETVAGLTLTKMSDGSILITGTNSSIVYIDDMITAEVVAGRKYCISGHSVIYTKEASMGLGIAIDIANNINTPMGYASKSGTCVLGFGISPGTHNEFIYPMLEEVVEGNESLYPHAYVPSTYWIVSSGNKLSGSFTANGALNESFESRYGMTVPLQNRKKYSVFMKEVDSFIVTYARVGTSSTNLKLLQNITYDSDPFMILPDQDCNFYAWRLANINLTWGGIYEGEIDLLQISYETEGPQVLRSFAGNTLIESPSTITVAYPTNDAGKAVMDMASLVNFI